MAKCEICDFIKNNKLQTIYEDDKIVAALAIKPSFNGHVLVLPKKHYSIIEQVPDHEVAQLFWVANKISIILFESLQVQGTNIFVQNGTSAGQTYSHFMINIVPRMPEDNINLEWQPKQLTQEELSTVELKIKDQTKSIGHFEQEQRDPVNMDKENKKLDDESDYLVKSLRRIP
jgi:histidine triad (HIT) family protein